MGLATDSPLRERFDPIKEITHRPGFIRAVWLDRNAVLIYRSPLVQPGHPFLQPVVAATAGRKATGCNSQTVESPDMMFGEAVVEVLSFEKEESWLKQITAVSPS